MKIIENYFPTLDKLQKKNIQNLGVVYSNLNRRFNLISRKDIENLYERHVLHSLSIAKFFKFAPSSKIVDIGTGGGFPGIPLAILFPDTQFHLTDSIRKKIMAVAEVKQILNLDNVKTHHARVETLNVNFDFAVCRAVAPLSQLVKLTKEIILPSNERENHGLICLKGGDLEKELAGISQETEVLDLKNCFKEPFFETKKIVFVKM